LLQIGVVQVVREEPLSFPHPINVITVPACATRSPVTDCFRRVLQRQTARECLNANQFLSIEDPRSKIEAWRMDYNH
jgi:hypothetical protein